MLVLPEYLDKFIGFASVMPPAIWAPNELERAVTKLELRGVKLYPSGKASVLLRITAYL